MAEKECRKDENEIVPWMEVELAAGELGEQDVSSAKITQVEKGQQGKVEAIKVSKGLLF